MIENPEFIAQLRRIELALKPGRHTRKLGIHQHNHRGRSLEFAEYREYRPGDELKDLDWRVYGRTDRYYIKQRDTHTPVRCLILFDDTSSMGFQSTKAEVSKLRAGLLLCFGIGYLLNRQGDAFSFQTLSDHQQPLNPRSSKKALVHLTRQLAKLDQSLPHAINSEFSTSRGSRTIDHLFVVSDFMVPESLSSNWLQEASRIAFQTTCFRVLDPEERDPNPKFQEVLDFEADDRFSLVTPREWESYRKNFHEHEQQLLNACRRQHIDIHTLTTQVPYHHAVQGIIQRLCRG